MRQTTPDDPAPVAAGAEAWASVIIATRNRASLLEQALASIARAVQERESVEIVVIDDGSSDDTARVVAAFAGLVVYEKQERQGVSRARNRGAEVATSDILMFFDDDDLWLGDRPLDLIRALRSSPDIDWITADAEAERAGVSHSLTEMRTGHRDLTYLPGTASEHLYRLETETLFAELLRRNLFTVGAWVVRRSAFLNSGGFDVSLSHGEDWQLYLKLAASFSSAYWTGPPVVSIRTHGQNASASGERMKLGFVEALAALNKFSLSESQKRLTQDAYERASLGLAYDALVRGDPRSARQHLRSHVRDHGLSTRTLSFFLSSYMPAPVLRMLRAAKQLAVGR